MVAATIRPWRYHAKIQKSLFEGTVACKDADDAESNRWILLLSQLLVGTSTLIVQLLFDKPGNSQLLGRVPSSNTTRSRVRVTRWSLCWLAVDHVTYPAELAHVMDYLHVRLSEPCSCAALKRVHLALVFMETVAGVPEPEKHTTSTLYPMVYKVLARTSADFGLLMVDICPKLGHATILKSSRHIPARHQDVRKIFHDTSDQVQENGR